VHEPKVVRHEIKGDHAIVVNKHDARHHPTQVQQLFTATYENPSESGIDAPVIASGHTAKKHFHVDENGRAHHKVLREEKGHHKQDWSKSQSYDCAGGPHRAAHSRTPRGRRERRSSVPLFFDDEDPGNKTDGLASAGLLAFALVVPLRVLHASFMSWVTLMRVVGSAAVWDRKRRVMGPTLVVGGDHPHGHLNSAGGSRLHTKRMAATCRGGGLRAPRAQKMPDGTEGESGEVPYNITMRLPEARVRYNKRRGSPKAKGLPD